MLNVKYKEKSLKDIKEEKTEHLQENDNWFLRRPE
jgi:hypothetical protein